MDDDEDDAGSSLQKYENLCRGLTDEQRREIRQSQRSLRKEIPDLDISEASRRNNKIHENIRYIRESVLDADNLYAIVKKACNKIQTFQGSRYDMEELIRKLVPQVRVTIRGKSYFDWVAFGKEAGKCFNAVPTSVSFLKGPVENGGQCRMRQVKKKGKDVIRENIPLDEKDIDDVEEEQPLEMRSRAGNVDGNRLSAVEANIRTVQQTLVAKIKQTYAEKKRTIGEDYGGVESIPKRIKRELKCNTDVCAVKLLFNPKSFTETVENIYHYSFLVKDGSASLKVRDGTFLDNKNEFYSLQGGPVANYITSSNKKNVATPVPRQAVVSLTMENWKDMIKAYNVKESDVKHRGNLN